VQAALQYAEASSDIAIYQLRNPWHYNESFAKWLAIWLAAMAVVSIGEVGSCAHATKTSLDLILAAICATGYNQAYRLSFGYQLRLEGDREDICRGRS
jgi:hypothetical protein